MAEFYHKFIKGKLLSLNSFILLRIVYNDLLKNSKVNIVAKADKKEKSVSLILGSGGARGLAHIGVIHYLEENGYKIESISGCSIGALIGGIYATGKLDIFEKWVRDLTHIDILTLLDLSWNSSGLVKGDKIINTLIDLIGDVKIEDLAIEFTAVAADIKNEKEVWLSSGSLFDAIRASISLPMFFTPYTINGVELVDGGTLNPVPIAPTFQDTTSMSIAINLGAKSEEGVEKIERKLDEGSLDIHENIQQFLVFLKEKVSSKHSKNWNVYEVANQAFDAMQNTIARQKLAAYPPDILVDIPRDACGTLEFDRAKEMIELGYKKVQHSLES